jgi:hypothetical protein
MEIQHFASTYLKWIEAIKNSRQQKSIKPILRNIRKQTVPLPSGVTIPLTTFFLQLYYFIPLLVISLVTNNISFKSTQVSTLIKFDPLQDMCGDMNSILAPWAHVSSGYIITLIWSPLYQIMGSIECIHLHDVFHFITLYFKHLRKKQILPNCLHVYNSRFIT